MPLVIGCLGLLGLAIVCSIGVIWAGGAFYNELMVRPDHFYSPRGISYFIPVTGVLNAGNEYEEFWAFDAAAGDQIVITMSSNQLDSFVTLYTADGTFLADDDDSGGGEEGLDARLIYIIPEDGRYVVGASDWFILDEGGAYTLLIEEQ